MFCVVIMSSRRKSPTTLPIAFDIEDLRAIDEWMLRACSRQLQWWIALDGLKTEEVFCVNLRSADRIARWTVMPLPGRKARFTECALRRRSWVLATVANGLEAVDAASALYVEYGRTL